jgi:hypothetical protein
MGNKTKELDIYATLILNISCRDHGDAVLNFRAESYYPVSNLARISHKITEGKKLISDEGKGPFTLTMGNSVVH